MRVCVVGAGSAGRRHIRNLLELGCDVGVIEPNAQRLASACAEYGIRFGDIATADAVVIASPAATHLGWAERALDDDIPAFIEKPIGLIHELDSWRDLAKASRSVTTQVGYQLRFHRDLIALRQRWSHRSVKSMFACNTNMQNWHGDSYGPWLLECSHEIDAALWCGAPADVRSAHFMAGDTAVDIMLGDWFVSIDSQTDQWWRCWRLYTAGGSYGEVDYQDESDFRVENDLAYKYELAHFIECVREQTQTDCPLSEGVKVLEICQQVEAMRAKAA